MFKKQCCFVFAQFGYYKKRTPLENIGLNKKYCFTDNGLRYINCLDLSKAMAIV